MYFWKTNELAEAIKANNISDRDWKNYYLATSIFILVSMYLSALSPRTGGVASLLVELVLIVVITVLGINITFKTNEASNGGNYISRVTALGFPILIKILLLGILVGFFIGVLEGAQFINVGADMPIAIFTVLAQVFFFWRINLHLKFINFSVNA